MKKKVLCISAAFFLLTTLTKASDSLSMPALHPSGATAYDIDQGLSVSCIRSVIADATGRLWLNPCVSMEVYRSLSFFQYDTHFSSF